MFTAIEDHHLSGWPESHMQPKNKKRPVGPWEGWLTEGWKVEEITPRAIADLFSLFQRFFSSSPILLFSLFLCSSLSIPFSKMPKVLSLPLLFRAKEVGMVQIIYLGLSSWLGYVVFFLKKINDRWYTTKSIKSQVIAHIPLPLWPKTVYIRLIGYHLGICPFEVSVGAFYPLYSKCLIIDLSCINCDFTKAALHFSPSWNVVDLSGTKFTLLVYL